MTPVSTRFSLTKVRHTLSLTSFNKTSAVINWEGVLW